MIRVRRQVRLIEKRLVFSLPKGGKERDIPLPDSLSLMLAQHIAEYPPVTVTLPWKTPEGDPYTACLLFVRPDGRPHHGKSFGYTWQVARAAAGAPSTRDNGMHVLCATRLRRPGSLLVSTFGLSRSTWVTVIPGSRSGRTRT